MARPETLVKIALSKDAVYCNAPAGVHTMPEVPSVATLTSAATQDASSAARSLIFEVVACSCAALLRLVSASSLRKQPQRL